MTSSDRPLRVLQIGLGTWGASWAAIVDAAPGIEPVGWVDASATALAAAPDHIPTFGTLDDALDEQTLRADAVLVTTGIDAHAPVAKAALEAGLHVLVEKPFAASLAEAAALVELAAQREVVLMVSQNYRFHAGPTTVRRALQEGRIGEPGQIQIVFRKRFPPSPRRAYHASRQPLLLDMFVHHADLLRCVLGREPTWLECRAWNPSWSAFDDPASAAIVLAFGDDLTVQWQGSWESTAPSTLWSGTWVIEGSAGALRWASRGDQDDEEPDWVELHADDTVRRIPLAAVDHRDRHGSLQAFARAVRTGEAPPASGRDNLGTLRICFAAIASAASGRRVELTGPGAR